MTGCSMTDVTDKKNILIITGGNVDKDFAALWVKENHFDFCIAADRGVEAAEELGIHTDHLIGDFDSADPEVLSAVIKKADKVTRLSSEKDATDTELAIKEALKLSPHSVCILGATGDRADHTFTTLMSMAGAFGSGADIYAVDKNNKIYAASGDICIDKNKQHGDYVSLSVISDSASITIKGMKYCLDGQVVERGSSLCQSNEITEDVAYISVRNGIALVFESKDGD